MPGGFGGIGLPGYGGTPDDLKKMNPATQEVAKRTTEAGKTLGLSTGTAAQVGAVTGGLIQAGMTIFDGIVAFAINKGAWLIAVMLDRITKVRTSTIPGQLEISAAVLGEFLAFDISKDVLKPGRGPDATIAAANTIGGALHDRLEKEFAPDGVVTLKSGAAAARTFSGYAVNFAVQNTIISTLADGLSFHLLENFKELGVETAQNLGLGRLQRRAMGPLIDNTIATPYDRHLKAKYRPELLQPADYVRAYYAGRLTRAQLSEKIGQKGITEADIDELIKQVASDFGQADIARLIRYGELTRDAAVQMLKDQGWPEQVAKIRLRAVELARVDGKEAEFVNVAEQQYVDGFIDDVAFEKVLAKTHLSDEEKQWERNIVGQRKDAARKRLSLSDMRRMYLDGIIDISEWDDYVEALGYSEQDRKFLLFDLLKLASDDAKKAKAVADAAARKAAKAAGA